MFLYMMYAGIDLPPMCSYDVCWHYHFLSPSSYVHELDCISYRLLIPPIAPSVERTTVLRLNKTAFSITTNLDYTGGGIVTHFLVSFRENGASEWSSDKNVPATLVPNSDNLGWTGVIRSDDFAVFAEFEFRVQVANERDMTTSAFMQTEEQSGFSN